MRRPVRSLRRLQHYNVTPVCGEDGPLLFDSCHGCCTLCTRDRVRGLCLRVLLALSFDGILWGNVLYCQHNKKQRAAYIVGHYMRRWRRAHRGPACEYNNRDCAKAESSMP